MTETGRQLKILLNPSGLVVSSVSFLSLFELRNLMSGKFTKLNLCRCELSPLSTSWTLYNEGESESANTYLFKSTHI